MAAARNLRVPAGNALPGSISSPPGSRVRVVRPTAVHADGPLIARRLDARRVMSTFERIDPVDHDVRIDVIDDISWSMSGGNDSLGLRHEAVLVYLEHVIRSTRSRRRRRSGRTGTWTFKCRTFDGGGTCLDTDELVLAPAALPALRSALLGPTFGGISCLGPSLAASVADTSLLQDTAVIRIVMSDLELFDPPGVLGAFAAAPADLNLAIVFRSPVPADLDPDRVRIYHVDPDTTPAELVATHLHDAVRDVLRQRAGADHV